MNLADNFRRLADEWRSHCERVAHSSNLQDRLDHPAFPQLVALGREAVPLMMERVINDDEPPWEFVLQEITGVRFIDDPGDFSPEEARTRRLYWWSMNEDQYAAEAPTVQL